MGFFLKRGEFSPLGLSASTSDGFLIGDDLLQLAPTGRRRPSRTPYR